MTRRLDRRQALGVLGSVSLGGILAACGSGDGDAGDGTATVEPRTPTSRATAELFEESASCTLSPEQAEGPYYFDVDAIRSDIREDRDGVPLRLALRIRGGDACEPIENAVVDVWHCDAEGAYSGFEAASSGGPGGGRTDEETYLRGAQATNADGIAEFRTIFPGAYSGRAVHVHLKVHLDKRTLLTSQLYFPDEVTAKVLGRGPYRAGDVGNDADGIFDPALVLTMAEEGDGWVGAMTIDVARA